MDKNSHSVKSSNTVQTAISSVTARFSKERHENLLTIYHKRLIPYQKRLEWDEERELANHPVLAKAYV